MAKISGVPAGCRDHAQRIVDIANKKIGELKDRHRENIQAADRHLSLYHNSMERVVNASNPGLQAKALGDMIRMYRGTVQGRSPEGQYVNPSQVAGEFYARHTESAQRKSKKQKANEEIRRRIIVRKKRGENK